MMDLVMKSVDISVIMPVYNAKAYIGRAIESVLSQDFKSFELILIDDGSTDGSGAICDEFAKGDDRIVLIHQKNAGTCAARNVGLSIAKGKYITFCDHDDEFLPHLLRDNFELIEKENADVLQFSVNRIFTEQNNLVIEQRLKNRSILAKDLPYKYLDVRLNENFVDVWSHLYKRDVISNLTFNPIFNHGMEDVCFNLAVMPRIRLKYVLNSGVYYNHYLYANSSGAVSKLKPIDDVVNQLKTLFEMEFRCLKDFFIPQNGSESRGVEVLKMNMSFLENRVNLASKADYAKFKNVNLFCCYPFKLSLMNRLYLWSFSNGCWLYRIMEKIGFDSASDNFKQSALYGFFENISKSKRGRWLFDLCNGFVKVITLPFRLLK